jgi:small ubiquitin-related modifier
MLVDTRSFTFHFLFHFFAISRVFQGNEVIFKIKKSTPLKKLMDTYCDRMKLNPLDIRFVFEGQNLLREQTPKEVGMSSLR